MRKNKKCSWCGEALFTFLVAERTKKCVREIKRQQKLGNTLHKQGCRVAAEDTVQTKNGICQKRCRTVPVELQERGLFSAEVFDLCCQCLA